MRYPVHLEITPPVRSTRLQLVMRLLLFAVLGLCGLSFGLVFVALYLGLAALAAVRISGGRRWPEQDGPRLIRALAWLAAIEAYFSLATDALPSEKPADTLSFSVEPSGHPTVSSALWRVITGLPSAGVLALLLLFGGLVWLVGALCVLWSERLPGWVFRYQAGTTRWAVRLLAYQASLVVAYPPFALQGDDGPGALPALRA